jgi:hypothetical protein
MELVKGATTIWGLARQRAISSHEPLPAVILWMLAISRAVIMDGRDISVLKLFSQLAIPVHRLEGLQSAVRLDYCLNLNSKVVVCSRRGGHGGF